MKTAARRAIVFLLSWISFAGTLLAAPATQPVIAPSFVIGVWYQPVASFAKWKARGINTLVGCELEGGAVTRAQWTAAARAAGLCYIIKPGTDATTLAADAADPYLLAWEQQDEPDGAGNTSPAQIQNVYSSLKQAKPVFLNFDGWKMQYRAAADYLAYVQGADWLAADYYVVNRGEGSAAIPKIGVALDKLAQWAPGKRRIAFIETSDQDLRVQQWASQPDASGTPPQPRMRGPTAAEVSSEVQMAIAHGVSGIVYFADVVGMNFEGFDGEPADVIGAQTAIDQQLTTPVPSPSPPPADPLAGTTITIMGHSYTLTPAK